jgi:hypothetical protein
VNDIVPQAGDLRPQDSFKPSRKVQDVLVFFFRSLQVPIERADFCRSPGGRSDMFSLLGGQEPQ